MNQADLQNLSDEELDKMVMQKIAMARPSAPKQDTAINFDQLSDEELDQMVYQKLMEQEAPKQEEGSSFDAFLQNFGDAATMGYLPQIQAGVDQAIDYIMPESEVDKKLKEQGFKIESEDESYVDVRDKRRQAIDRLQETNPTASTIGGLSGAISGGVAMGPLLGTAGKGASFGKKLYQAGKTGAAIGVARNPGDVEGEVDPLQIDERLENAKNDGLTGIALQGAGSGALKAVQAGKGAAKALKGFGELKALKASGAMLKDFRKAFGKEKATDLGRTMLDNEIVQMGDDVATIAKKANQARQQVGSKISQVLESTDEAAEALSKQNLNANQIKALRTSEVDMGTFAEAYKKEMAKRLRGMAGTSNIVKRVAKELDEMALNGKVGLKRLQEIRRSIDDQINFAKTNQELPGVQRELSKVRNKLQDLAKQRVKTVDKITGQNNYEKFIKANKDFSNLAEISDIANDRIARDQANSAFGLRERLSSGFGATIGGMMGGLPGAVIGGTLGGISTKVAKQYGTPVVARMSDSAARILERSPDLLGKYAEPLFKAAAENPEKFVAVVNMLKAEPEFRKALRKKEGILNRPKINFRDLGGEKVD